MPDYDHDLIAALAEGRLDPAEAVAAQRAIAADPEAAAAYAQHRIALDAIGATSPATLTDGERSRVRMAVAEGLGLDRTPVPSTPGRRTPWAAISIAAATLAALVAVVPISGLLTSDGQDTSAVSQGLAEIDSSARSADDAAEPMAGSGTEGAETDGISTTAAPSAQFEGVPDEDLDARLTALAADPETGEEKATSPTVDTLCATEAAAQIETAVDTLMFLEMTVGDQQVMVFFVVVDGLVEAAAYSPADCTLLETFP